MLRTGRFDFAKKVRPIALLCLLVMMIGFVVFNRYLMIFGIVTSGALGNRLLCEKCKRPYLQKPLRFLITGHGSGTCVRCGHNN
jgi:hypothetical protein